jgi:hypothetical protein
MPGTRMKHRRAVHKSTAGILNSTPEAVDPVGNPPSGLTENTVALPDRERTARAKGSLVEPATVKSRRVRVRQERNLILFPE